MTRKTIRTLKAAVLMSLLFVLPHTIDALASSVRASSATLGSGVATISSCQHGTVYASFDLNEDGSVGAVTLRNIDSTSCAGGRVDVSLAGSDLMTRARGTAAVPDTGSEITIPIGNADAKDVATVHVAIVN